MNKIQALDGFSRASDGDVVSRGTAVQTKMKGNLNFPTPPVDLAVLKTDIDGLSALMAESLDGSKKVIAEKNKQREVVIQKLRLLARYVEVTCKDDMAMFISSGFEPAATTRARPQGLSENIWTIDHGANSGQIVARLRAVPQAACYELRYAAVGNAATPPVWTTHAVTTVKTALSVNGLTPGTMYAFQVRSLSQSGYSDWSDSLTFICT
jgi:hypothetical protein